MDDVGVRHVGSLRAPNPALSTEEDAVGKSETRQKTSLLQVRSDDVLNKQLDAVRRQEDDIPTRAEMVRRLIVRAYDRLKR